MKTGIYSITNKITDKRYIGSAVNIDIRWSKHKLDLKNDKHHSLKLQRAWKKYGESAFEFEILYECDKSELLFCEQNWIDFYGVDNLYNIYPIAGSPLGIKRSDETKRKCQIAKNGYPVIQIDMEGNILGRFESVNEAARQVGAFASNISSSVREYVKCKNTMFVKSENNIQFALQMNKERREAKKTICAKIVKKSFSKQIYQINKETNQIIKKWNSASEAANGLSVSKQNISACALGKKKYRSAGGYIWKYVT